MGDPSLVEQEEIQSACKARLKRTATNNNLFKLFDTIIETGEGRLHVLLGTPGSGKSSLALLYLAYRFSCDLDEIRRHIVFRPDDFLVAYREGRDVLVWDDAGVWMRLVSRIHWDPLAVTLNAIFDVGRLHAPLVMFTMLSDRDLPRPLRYNNMLYRSRTRIWRTGYVKEKRAHRAIAITQFRKERGDWTQSYWDSSNEHALKFYHFRQGDPFYNWYLKMRKEYARFFLDYAMKNLKNSKLYELLKDSS